MKHRTETCPQCSLSFEFSEECRLVNKTSYSAPVIGMRALARYLDVFMIECPRCRETFPSTNVKLLGIFAFSNAWLPPVLLVALFTLFILSA